MFVSHAKLHKKIYSKKVLLQQQKTDIEEALTKAQFEYITRCAQDNEISLTELDDILQPIIQACTKDSIANGNYYIVFFDFLNAFIYLNIDFFAHF